MTQDKQLINLTRRQMLVGAGAIGLASAGAGLGTSALFRDTESFTGNRLVAGELDLKVDWQQRYFFGADGQAENDPSTWSPYPPGSDPASYPAAFPDNGTYNADGNKVNDDPDGLQDPIFTRRYIRDNPGEFDLGPEPSEQEIEAVYRAQFDDRSSSDQPIITLPDVKPGDCGELTLSMHLFDNPGYIWLGGELLENAENGVSDAELHDIPEGAEDDPLGPDSGDSQSGELADKIEACLFYDADCDNQFDEANQPCTVFVIDTSDSMKQNLGENGTNTLTKLEGVGEGLNDWFTAIVDGSDQLPFPVGLELFAGGSTGSVTLTTDYSSGSDLRVAVDEMRTTATSFPGSGAGDIEGAIDAAALQLEDCPDETSQRVMSVITNGVGVDASGAEGAASTALTNDQVDKFVTLGVAVTDSGVDTSLENIAEMTPPAAYFDVPGGDAARPAVGSTTDSIRSVIGDGGAVLGDQKIVEEGTLREVLDSISGPGGVLLDGNFRTEELDCFDPMGRYCIALKWCLPLEVGNEVQSDSVAFDIDLYTEQCRNNSDPSGRTPFAGAD